MKKALTAVLFAATAGYVYAQGRALPPTQQPAAPEVKVEKIVTAASVESREPVNAAETFDRNAGRVYTWTRIAASEAPVKIKHVYYYGEKKMNEIELDVKAKTYRVWSYKAVWPGKWKVEVTDETGKVLATSRFTVASAAESAAPEAPTQGK